MKLLTELDVILEKDEQKKVDGTYVGATFGSATIKKLKKMIKDLNIPKPVSSDKFHTTTIFSRTKFPDDFKALGKLDPPWKAIPDGFDLFTGRNKQKCLVLRYKCKEQVKRHEFLMDEYKASYDWPTFKCHLTLSYDCGDFDITKYNPKDYIDEIIIDNEYTEPLQLDWLANKKDEK